jgi:hypothetical protein
MVTATVRRRFSEVVGVVKELVAVRDLRVPPIVGQGLLLDHDLRVVIDAVDQRLRPWAVGLHSPDVVVTTVFESLDHYEQAVADGWKEP